MKALKIVGIAFMVVSAVLAATMGLAMNELIDPYRVFQVYALIFLSLAIAIPLSVLTGLIWLYGWIKEGEVAE
jgi:hypothetical protein